MGADYFSTYTPLPHDIEFKRIQIPEGQDREFIEPLVSDEIVANVQQYLEDIGGFDDIAYNSTLSGTPLQAHHEKYESLDVDEITTRADEFADLIAGEPKVSKEDVVVMLVEAWRNTGGRDCSYIEMNNIPCMQTGGMSWGDEPTEAYPYVALLGCSCVFDSPIVDMTTTTVPNRASDLLRMHANRLPDHDASKNGLLVLADVVGSMRDDLLMNDEATKIFDGLILNKHAS